MIEVGHATTAKWEQTLVYIVMANFLALAMKIGENATIKLILSKNAIEYCYTTSWQHCRLHLALRSIQHYA